jgi:5-aminopentanamidase
MAEITVACAQLAPVIGDLDGNRARACAAIEAADADLVVLPELMTTGYVFESEDELRALARPTEEAVAPWVEAAGDRVVVGGFAELGEDGRLYNSAAIVDREGVLVRYRKVHLWDAEREVFSEGREFPPVVDTELGRLGLCVCYDVEFPELVRGLALAGADILCVPVNWPRFPQPEGERPMDVVRVMAAASTNRLFIAIADRCGGERGVDWVSGTCVASPDGWLLAGPPERGEPVTLTARCDLAQAREKRINTRNDVLADRRPDVYAQLRDGV